MKIINNKIFIGVFALFGIMLFAACESYLDKAPETEYSDKEIFGNFFSFQGVIEEMYTCVVDKDKCGAWNNYSFADENVSNQQYPFDQGNYWSNSTYFFGQNVNTTADEAGRSRRVWEYAWFGIAKANLCLEKLEEPGLFTGTQKEYDYLKGQALFFRAWFNFEICRFWGGMPYNKRVLTSESFGSEEFQRLSFRQSALLMCDDFREAADLLPSHWDEGGNSPDNPGALTLGHNKDRPNKIMALGYLGKAYLFAARPMINEEETGSNTFDPELCRMAADAYGEAIAVNDQWKWYELTHMNEYHLQFWEINSLRPGKKEVIFISPPYDWNRVRSSTLPATQPPDLNGGANTDVPAHNLVENFGTADGYPLYDPDTRVWDATNPWKNRDPRFHSVIAADGDKIHNIPGLSTPDSRSQIVEAFTGGYHRDILRPGTVSGYYSKKFSALHPDYIASWHTAIRSYVPYMRLPELYLGYAEAVNWMTNGGPTARSARLAMTAEEAINVVRQRIVNGEQTGIPPIPQKFLVSKEVFFEEIVRERAVEFFMEGHRFDDLRFWNRNHLEEYRYKTVVAGFDRDDDGKPINMRIEVLRTRVAEKKHNWLPIQPTHVQRFYNFQQNPGW